MHNRDLKIYQGDEGLINDYEGQLALDIYQTDDEVVIKAPIAGVRPEDLEISVTDDVVTIRGERREFSETQKENYLAQECYWGEFSRSYGLPVAVDSDKAEASLKDGILTIKFPKQEKTKTKTLKIKTE